MGREFESHPCHLLHVGAESLSWDGFWLFIFAFLVVRGDLDEGHFTNSSQLPSRNPLRVPVYIGNYA